MKTQAQPATDTYTHTDKDGNQAFRNDGVLLRLRHHAARRGDVEGSCFTALELWE